VSSTKHVLSRALRHLQDKLSPRSEAFDYLSEPERRPPICPYCYVPLSRLVENVLYFLSWDAGRFTIEKNCMRGILCPSCGRCIDSPILRALVSYDNSFFERGTEGR
jgi:hypothetical protein